MKLTARGRIVVAVLVGIAVIFTLIGVVTVGRAVARDGDPSRGWTRYVEVRPWGKDNRIHVVVLKDRCFNAEDSAFHPKTVEYIPSDGELVIGCYRKGY